MKVPASSKNAPGEEKNVLTLQARFENLDQLREFVGRAAEACGFGEENVYAVQMAVDEAFTNIVEHACQGECENPVECTYEIGTDALTIHLIDKGIPFDPTAVDEPDLQASLEDRDVGGLGLYFIRKLMDEVYFVAVEADMNQPAYNQLTMIKRKEKLA